MGRVDVDRLLGELSAAQMREWEAFYRLEPWGDDWQRTAMLAMVIANVHRDPDERREPFEIEEFLPKFEGDENEEVMEEDETGALLPHEEPKWMQWKRAFGLMANSGRGEGE